MKNFSLGAHTTFLIALLFMVLVAGKSLGRLAPHHFSSHGRAIYEGDQSHYIHPKEGEHEEVGVVHPDTSGSSLPDCSHACGPCSPCKRVMVSFKCSLAESCPIVYRCMCKGKYYHVPSN